MSEHDRFSADDEALSALLDDALPAEQAEQLRQRLASQPALAARLQALKMANATVRDAYSGVADEPLPASVLELLRAINVVPFAARKPRRFFAIPTSIAAGIALAFGVALGILLGPRLLTSEEPLSIADGGIVARGTVLHEVLETVPSAQTRELAAQISATPRLTFKTFDGDYCRQVDLTSASGTTDALACRRDGSWQLEVVAFSARVATAPDGLYRPAAGTLTAVDAAIDSSIDGVPLESNAERELIGREWTNAP